MIEVQELIFNTIVNNRQLIVLAVFVIAIVFCVFLPLCFISFRDQMFRNQNQIFLRGKISKTETETFFLDRIF